MDVRGRWLDMFAALRNAGRPGIGAHAISAIDVALWDAKARALDLSLVDLWGAARDDATDLRLGRLHQLLDRPARRAADRVGRPGHPPGEDEGGSPPRRGRRPRRRGAPGRRPGRRADGRRQRRLHGPAGPRALGGLRRARRALARGTGLVRQPARAAARARIGGARRDGRRRRVRLRHVPLPRPDHVGGRRLRAGRRHTLRWVHRLPRRGRAVLRPHHRPVRALRAQPVGPRLLRRARHPPHRVLPRPRANRTARPGRCPRTRRRGAAPRPVTSRPRARAPTRRRRRASPRPETRPHHPPPTLLEEPWPACRPLPHVTDVTSRSPARATRRPPPG